MRKFIYIILLSCCSLFCTKTFAQLPIVTISAIDGTIDKSLPFDQPFILRVPIKEGNDIVELQYFELKGQNKNLADSYLHYEFKNKLHKKIKTIRSDDIEIRTVGEIKYAYVYFNYPNLLKVSKRYGIIARTAPDERFVRFLKDNIHQDTLFLDVIGKEYEKLEKRYYKKGSHYDEICLGNPHHDEILNIETILKIRRYIDANLAKQFNSIDELDKSIIESFKIQKDNNLDKIFLLKDSAKCCVIKAFSEQFNIDTTTIREGLYFLKYHFDKDSIKYIFNGEQVIFNSSYDKNLSSKQRYANISLSIERLKKIYPQIVLLHDNKVINQKIKSEIEAITSHLESNRKVIYKLNDTINASIKTLIKTPYHKGKNPIKDYNKEIRKELKKLSKSITGNLSKRQIKKKIIDRSLSAPKEEIDKLSKKMKERNQLRKKRKNLLSFKGKHKNIKTRISDIIELTKYGEGNKYFHQPYLLHDTNTFIGTFEAKNKLRITPDVSLASTTNIFRNKGIRSSLNHTYIPNIGFSISLQPINKNVNFNSYKKTGWQWITADVGWSLVNPVDSMSNIKNILENSTLYTGIGFRPWNNLVRVQAGTQWFYREKTDNMNVILERKLKPIITFGISIDLGIKDLLNGFTDVLPTLRARPPVSAPNTYTGANN